MLFYAYDSATKTAFVEDLGIKFNSFLLASPAAQVGFVDSISTSSAWSTYVSTTLTDGAKFSYVTGLEGTTWGVIGGSSNALANGNNYGLGVTLNVGNSASLSNTQGKVKGQINTPLTSLIQGLNANNPTAPLTGYFSGSGGIDNAANSWGDGKANLSFSTSNNIGATSTFQYLNASLAGSHTPTAYGNSFGNNTFSFDGTNLTYAVAVAAVPEPSSYAMMLGGLLMVGAMVARRRNSK